LRHGGFNPKFKIITKIFFYKIILFSAEINPGDDLLLNLHHTKDISQYKNDSDQLLAKTKERQQVWQNRC
jgi:hypothetical protein